MALALAKCARCSRVFTKVRSAVCVECQDYEDRDFNKIREVLETTPGLAADQVAERAEVSLACVLRLVEEGRIASVLPGAEVRCGRCGAQAISMTKRLCERCLVELDREFTQALGALYARRRARPRSSINKTHEVLGDKRKPKPSPVPNKIK